MIYWSKYKRFFTFGCSFTNYMWPSWADIISKEMPDAEFYNFGLSGAGNTLISYRIAEANNRFKFTDTDLVMVMFTTYCREDRWIDEEQASKLPNQGCGWLSGGNIFNNKFYPDSWVRDFANERGYMIRDAAVIDMTMKYLDSIPSTTYGMLSVPFATGSDSPRTDSTVTQDIYNIYQDTFSRFKPSFNESIIKANWKVLEHDYPFNDGHPAPYRYYDYLSYLGFNLSEKSKTYAQETSALLKSIPVRNIVPVYFPEQDANINKARKLLF